MLSECCVVRWSNTRPLSRHSSHAVLFVDPHLTYNSEQPTRRSGRQHLTKLDLLWPMSANFGPLLANRGEILTRLCSSLMPQVGHLGSRVVNVCDDLPNNRPDKSALGGIGRWQLWGSFLAPSGLAGIAGDNLTGRVPPPTPAQDVVEKLPNRCLESRDLAKSLSSLANIGRNWIKFGRV